MKGKIYGNYHGIKQIASKKSGELFSLLVVRDYETFQELELFCDRDFKPGSLIIGDDVEVTVSVSRSNNKLNISALSASKKVV